MNAHEIKKYDKQLVTYEKYIIILDKKYYDYSNIKIGDFLLLDIGEYQVLGVETFRKSFGVEGENIGLLTKKMYDDY